ncbi:hypothetical protein [Saccharibacillus sp. JS10]|uniref:hypothetical protein n=1 Tax=Saccharibacillus sp. JS10 TaxID=2950552 RepID=UPI00210F16A5|nr:hypothetical protein [Saccharibacillus sp. JS10]MCQ4088535.1 hypothetical protein [Saccharibacillus sp. JS10]
MIPFEKALPYDQVMGDLTVPKCPFCGAENVLLPIRPAEIKDIQTGKKRLTVFPCCHGRLTVLDCDDDYLMTDTVVK